MTNSIPHIPVMLSEVLDLLSPKDDACYVDGTFGAGGYSQGILKAANCRVHAFDQDPITVAAGKPMVEAFRRRLTIHRDRFSNMEAVLHEQGATTVDGVALDIGVSSMQLDDKQRGFSFLEDGPLDMRMSGDGQSAADLVNHLDEKSLARVIRVFGEERQARRIAKAIVMARSNLTIRTTRQLAEIIESAVSRNPKTKIHPATRSFLALRIYLNNELEELAKGLAAAERLLKPAGRIVVVAFHSLEDRIIKRFFSQRFGNSSSVSRYRAQAVQFTEPEPSFRRPFRRVRRPNEDEVNANPRARSARLRAGERTSAPAWPLDLDSIGVPRGI
jgi:16S rRNA (cytosine1402-N4)-methyltransferase